MTEIVMGSDKPVYSMQRGQASATDPRQAVWQVYYADEEWRIVRLCHEFLLGSTLDDSAEERLP